MGSKVLYINNVTTDDYINNYADSHIENDKFTYVTFSEYKRTVNDNLYRRGDIFFNGNKITYYNDVDSSYVVTDKFDNFVAYVNNEGCVDVGKIGIRISDGNISTNKYELFNVETTSELSYIFINEVNDYVEITDGQWNIYNNNYNVNINNGTIPVITTNDNSYNIVLAYSFKVNNKTHVSYAHYDINNISNINDLEFVSFPEKLAYGTIFTPIVKTIPESAIQNKLTWSSGNSSYVEILNERTGTFRCVCPGETSITCSYNNGNGSVTNNLTVLKVNPWLCVSIYGNTILNNDSTNAYAHYDNRDLSISGYNFKLFAYDSATSTPAGTLITGSETKSNTIDCNNNSLKYFNKVVFELPEAYFRPNKTAIQLYNNAQQHTPNKTDNIEIIPTGTDGQYEVNEDYNTIDFIVKASSNNGGIVDTNYAFQNVYETSGGLSNFTVTDISYNFNTGITYTYVTAQISPNLISELYNELNIENPENIIAKIKVKTTDGISFISSEEIRINANDIIAPSQYAESNH